MPSAFVKIKMCYVYNQWYDISCATLYIYISLTVTVFSPNSEVVTQFDRLLLLLTILFVLYHLHYYCYCHFLTPLAATNNTITCICDSHISLPFQDPYTQVNNRRLYHSMRLPVYKPALYQLQNYDSFLNLNNLSTLSRFMCVSRHLSAYFVMY